MTLAYDGTTNDIAALQAVVAAAPAHTEVVLDGGRTCRLVIDYSVPEYGLVGKPGVKLNLNGTLLNYECHGDVYCTRPVNGFEVYNGRAALTVSDGLTSQQGVYHAPFGLGSAYGEITSLTNRGPYIEAEDWMIRDMEISSMKPANGWGICGIGGFKGGKIINVKINDSATLWGAIDFDHGTLGIPGTIPQNRTNFGTGHAPSGSFRSVFPKNIWMDNIRIGRLTNQLSEAIRQSGCSGFVYNKVSVEYCGTSAFSHYAGDFGAEFVEYGPDRYQAYMGTVMRDLRVKEAGPNSSVLRIDAYGDNVGREPNYTPLSNPIWQTNLLIDGVTADSAYGVALSVGPIRGGTIRRGRFNWHRIGVATQPGVTGLLVDDCYFHGGDSAVIHKQGDMSGVTFNRTTFDS